MKKLERYYELEEVCYSYIRKEQTIPTKVFGRNEKSFCHEVNGFPNRNLWILQ